MQPFFVPGPSFPSAPPFSSSHYYGGIYLPPLPPPPPLQVNPWWGYCSYIQPAPPPAPPPHTDFNFQSQHKQTHCKKGGRGGGKGGKDGGSNDKKSQPAASQVFNCKTCNREYKSEETYTAHVQAHVKCTHCDFTAIPKVVKEHLVVHFLPDFLTFNTAKDTERWRNERRKNYPTIANVAKKKQQETDRKERRQILDTPLYRYVNHLIGESGSIEHSQGRGQNQRGGSGKGRGHPPNKRKMNFQTECVKERKVEATDHSRTSKENQRSSVIKIRRKKPIKNSDVVPYQPTLLEKLLRNEVRREHNTILQCVHYIVCHDFWRDSQQKN